MRIAVFTKKTTFHKGYGGLETQNKSLCEELSKRGHDVVVFSPKWELEIEEDTNNWVKYIFIPCLYKTIVPFWKLNKSWYKKSYQVFSSIHESEPFDLVFGQSSTALGIIRHKKELGLPIISLSHGTIIGEIRTRYMNVSSFKSMLKLIPDTGFALYNFFFRQRDFVHGSDKVITVSNAVKQSLIEETFAIEDKFIVIHNGIDPQRILEKETQIEEAKYTFKMLYVGQVMKEKGADKLVKLFEDSRFSDFVLEVVGEGPYLKTLQEEIKEKGLEKNFIIRGKLPYDEVLNLLKSHDTNIFILPTNRVEGFPMVLVEAMFAGLPVVAFDLGGVSDAIDEGSTGYIVSAGDLDTFKERILSLYNDPSTRVKMGVLAKGKARSLYTIEEMVNQYEKVFEEVSKL